MKGLQFQCPYNPSFCHVFQNISPNISMDSLTPSSPIILTLQNPAVVFKIRNVASSAQ
jgi:hypothetical protein